MRKHTRSLIGLLHRSFGELKEIRGAEIGVWQGHNAEKLLSHIPYLFLYMIDRYRPFSHSEAVADVRMGPLSQADFDAAYQEATRRTAFAATRSEFWVMSSFVAASQMPDDSLDFIFLDGCHDFENVQSDLEVWPSKLRNGGIFCGHDYGGCGDRKGRYGVKRAVDAWAFANEKEIQTLPGNIWWTSI